MANKNTKAKAKQDRKDKKHYHGKPCVTSFYVEAGRKNPETKRKSPWRGKTASNKKVRVPGYEE